ncbi:hypothetical protein IGI04_043057 [Brassica rapa subsp. trilocularis]|uniref:F-box domain-containing protein n=1 Tax=Brassica rapa subsp. trilocularis TaxID=1813537 RepID=A0ABQ7KGX1_BRACM|nr:hypothetical protein IGI04_043057 [Brassica rapa subsp. trilocularis]
MDRISDLPDEILHHIGSFLSAKEAAFATLLSKRWRTLFTIIPNLHFSGSLTRAGGGRFKDFADGVLALPVSSRVRTFSLKCKHVARSQKTTLLLSGVQEPKHHGSPRDGDYMFGKWCSTVSSTTLKRLTIRRMEWFSYDETDEENIRVDSRCLTHEFDNVSFHTPALTYLEYSDYVPKEYLSVNLDSLVEANLNLWVDEEGVWRPYHATTFNPMTLINGLKHVAILSLTSEAVEMFDVLNESIPMFVMVSQLSLGLSERCWFSLTNVIKKFPNLKTLIIEGSLHYDYSEYSCLLSCPVEVLKINEYYGSVNELEQTKHFLGKLPCLELVVVCARETSSEAKLQIMAELLMIPRASSKCKIQLGFVIRIQFSPKYC